MARRSRIPADEPVLHVIRIEDWNFDYSFGVEMLPASTKLYYDSRRIQIFGAVEQPRGITAKQGRVICFPEPAFLGAAELPKRGFGERLGAVVPEEKPTRPVGFVYYRGTEYVARLFFPSDMLLPILQVWRPTNMGTSPFHAEKGGRDAAISEFTFAEPVL
jgi:hypothetical protein